MQTIIILFLKIEKSLHRNKIRLENNAMAELGIGGFKQKYYRDLSYKI